MSAPPDDDGAIFGSRVRVVVTTIAIVSLVATVAAMVFGRSLAPPPPGPTDSLGRGAIGHHALYTFLTELGVATTRWTESDYGPVSAPLLVLEPTHTRVELEGVTLALDELIAARRELGRATVVALPKWSPGVFPPMVVYERREAIAGTLAAIPIDVTLLPDAPSDRPPQELTSIDAQSEHGAAYRLELHVPRRMSGGVPVLYDEHGAFIVRDESATVFVVSDPDILHSAGIHRADHARVIADLVRERLDARSVVIDEVFHGQARTRSIAELLGRWPGILLLVHLALLAAVTLLAGARRFGPAAPPPEPRGFGPGEVIGVAADVLSAGTRPAMLTQRYVAALVADVARQLGLAAPGSTAALAERIDQTLASRGESAGLAELVRAVGALAPRASVAESRALALRAHTLRARLVEARLRTPKTKAVPLTGAEKGTTT